MGVSKTRVELIRLTQEKYKYYPHLISYLVWQFNRCS